jgi:hypothetical protein
MGTLNVEIIGTRALLQHNIRLANPMDPYTKALVELTKNRKTRGADKDEALANMARAEWEGGLYHSGTEPDDDGMGPYIPAAWVQKALTEAARLTRDGKNVERGVTIVHERHRIEYAGPRDLDGMWGAGGRYVDQRMVTVARAKVLRTRPKFGAGWKASVALSFASEVVNSDDIKRFFESAGRYIGMGDARSIGFGRFDVVFR